MSLVRALSNCMLYRASCFVRPESHFCRYAKPHDKSGLSLSHSGARSMSDHVSTDRVSTITLAEEETFLVPFAALSVYMVVCAGDTAFVPFRSTLPTP